MDADRFAELRAFTMEQRSFEAKRSGSLTDNAYFARVARAVLAMSNLQDGGYVVLGIDDGEPLVWAGMDANDLSTWSSRDVVADKLAPYSDPPVHFELAIHEDHLGNRFVVLEVREFADSPVICKRNFPSVLQEGFCYVRSRRKPESLPVPGQAEMRELLDLATEKALRRLLGTVERAGGRVVGTPTDDQRFESQAGDFA